MKTQVNNERGFVVKAACVFAGSHYACVYKINICHAIMMIEPIQHVALLSVRVVCERQLSYLLDMSTMKRQVYTGHIKGGCACY